MRISILLGFAIASVFILCFGPTISFADNTIYQITGRVLDINETGILGANVTLMTNGVAASTIGSNPTISTVDGTFSFNFSQPGVYQVIAEKDYPNGSVTMARGTSSDIIVSEDRTDYPAIINLVNNTQDFNASLPAASPTITAIAAQVTITPSPTAMPTSTPTVVSGSTNATITPIPVPSEVNSTDAVASNMPTVTSSNTPVPTPSIAFTFIPTLAAICLLALKKRN